MLDGITDVTLADGGAVAAAAWQRGWTPPEKLSVSGWADKHRKMPRESSPEPGDWHTSRTPYLRFIMDALSVHSPVTEVSVRKSTQVGGTEAGINFLGYVIDHAPGPMMYVLPTLDTARKFNDQRLQPMIDLMPELASKVGKRRSRDSGNTTLTKKFPAGFLVLSGANSANSLATMPVRYLVLDERSKYPHDVGDQGRADAQAIRRTSAYTSRKKILSISSPTIVDDCAITEAVEAGTDSEYHVPCPHCHGLQVLCIDQLTDDGCFVCVHCGQLIEEKHKGWMLEEYGYSADGLARWVHKHPERLESHVSVSLWSAYAAPNLGYTWKEIADMRREAAAYPEKEVTFVNTILGLAFAGAAQRIEATEIQKRAEKWLRRTIPRGCLILTAAVDVQANRFSISIWGWGRGEAAWAIDWVELPGDPTRKEDWAVVDEYLAKPLINSCGVSMRPLLTAVDSGNWTKEVYDYVRPRQQRGVLAIKGMRMQDHPLIARPRKEDTNRKGRPDRHGIRRWNIGVTTAKTTIMQRLLKDGELLDEDRRRFHFPADHEPDFYTQLCAERYDLTARRWLKPAGARNEVFDEVVYAYAMACSPMVRLNVLRDSDWAALEAKLEPVTADLFAPGQAPELPPADKKTGPDKSPEPTAPTAAIVPRGTHRPKRGGFATNW